MRFKTTVLLAGKTATGIQVPDDVVAALGSGKKPPVRVTINGYTYRSTIASVDGRFMVGINSDVREKAGVAAHDKVDVNLELDTEPRKIEVPPDFKKVLDRHAAAKRSFEGLSYSKQYAYVYPIEHAKTAETRERRIAKAISDLEGSK